MGVLKFRLWEGIVKIKVVFLVDVALYVCLFCWLFRQFLLQNNLPSITRVCPLNYRYLLLNKAGGVSVIRTHLKKILELLGSGFSNKVTVNQK